MPVGLKMPQNGGRPGANHQKAGTKKKYDKKLRSMLHQLAHRQPWLKNSRFICFGDVNGAFPCGFNKRVPAWSSYLFIGEE